jgi:hypothetical protein
MKAMPVPDNFIIEIQKVIPLQQELTGQYVLILIRAL